MGSGQLHIALSYAKKSLADSRAHHLSSIETQSRLLLAQIWVWSWSCFVGTPVTRKVFAFLGSTWPA
jgi:hypothetical protein